MAAPVAKYTLTATIGRDDIPILKAGKYKLCVAKLVNGKFNVVWEGRDFLSYNVFEFSDEFQVFGTAAVAPGHRVYASTNQSNIKYGQTATLDSNGIMSSASGGPDQSGKFKVLNNYGQIYFGVAAKTPTSAFTPIYAATTPTVRGETTFTPMSKVLVFFSNELSTSTIFVDSISDTLEVDFTGGVQKVDVTYMTDPNSPTNGNGAWTINGSSISLSRTYHTRTNTFTTIQPSEALLKKIDGAMNGSASNVVAIIRGVATFVFGGANAQVRAQTAAQWLGMNQPADGIARISNAQMSNVPVMGQYRVQAELGIDSTSSLTPSLDKGKIDPSFRVYCEQISDDPLKRFDSMTIQWNDNAATIGYARSIYNNALDATNASYSIGQTALPPGLQIAIVPTPFGASTTVTTYFTMDPPSPVPSQNQDLVRNWYNAAALNPNWTGFTWYSPAM